MWKMQLTFANVFFCVVICHIILDFFLTLKFKTCKNDKSEKQKMCFSMFFHEFHSCSVSKSKKEMQSKFLSNGGPKSMKIVENSIKIEPWGFLETKIN